MRMRVETWEYESRSKNASLNENHGSGTVKISSFYGGSSSDGGSSVVGGTVSGRDMLIKVSSPLTNWMADQWG